MRQIARPINHLLSSALCVTVFATAAFADTHLTDLKSHAGQVQRGSEQVSLLLKAKQLDAQAIRDKIATIGEDIENLQRLVVELEAAKPQFVQRGDKDWELLKMKVQLLSINYNIKHALSKEDDLKKNRSLLRAHATDLMRRSTLLRETATRLER